MEKEWEIDLDHSALLVKKGVQRAKAELSAVIGSNVRHFLYHTEKGRSKLEGSI